MKINFKLNVTLGPKEFYSSVLLTDRETIIGSSEDVDVRLQGDRISGKHAVLSFDQDLKQWYVTAKDGDVRLHGELIEREEVAVGKPISIGPYLIRLEIQREATEHAYVLSDKVVVDQTPSNGYSTKLRDAISRYYFWVKEHQRWSLFASLVFALILFAWLAGGSSAPEVDDQGDVANYTIDQKREIDRYTSWIDGLWKKGDFASALSVASTAYISNSEVAELKSTYINAIRKRVNELSELGEYKKAQSLIVSVNQDLQDNDAVQALAKRLQADMQQKQDHLAKYQDSKRQFDHIIEKGELALKQGDANKARRFVSSMDPLLTKFEPDWRNQKEQLMEQVNKALELDKRLFAEQRKDRLENMKLLNRHFEQCMSFFQAGDRAAAYVECRKVAEGSQDNRAQNEIQIWLDLLEPSFNKELSALSAKAEDCYKNRWVGCAFDKWQRILKLDPENRRIEQRLQSAKLKQLEIARTKFREARAYADVGRPKRALATLKELKLIYPVSESEIYTKADSLIGRLGGTSFKGS